LKRIIFLMSDTGGGHRAAAEAVKAAVLSHHEADIQLVDVFRNYSPFPFKYMPEFYPWLVNHSKSSWGMGYKLLDSRRVSRTAARGMYATMETRLKQMVLEHPADVIVSFHSVITRPSLQALLRLEKRPPFLVVVTDLVTTPMFWYDRRSDFTFVPTQTAFERGLYAGVKDTNMQITGLPVHPNFEKSLPPKAEARASLGWDPHLPAIIIVGGGEGMGPIYKTARTLNDMRLKCQIAVVAGRNKPLKAQLEASEWNQPTYIHPFVNDMPRLMAAGDVLVTKAGPGTISEACIAGLPMILYDAIPGQEDGNVTFVVDNQIGAFCPSPHEVADTAAEWLAAGELRLQKLSRNAKRAARPKAVWEIAKQVWDYAQKPPIINERRKFLDDVRVVANEFYRDVAEITKNWTAVD